MLKKRGNRTHKKTPTTKCKVRRPLYARECARVRARARVLFLFFLLFCRFFFGLLLARGHAHAALALCCFSTCSVYGRTQKRRTLSSHVVHSLHSSATSCNARRCPHLWAMLLVSAGSMEHEGALPFTEGCARAWTKQKIWHHLPPGR